MKASSALIILIINLGAVSQICGINLVKQLPEQHGDKFYYFGFGSNMLAKRIHIQNPTAVIVGPALLENYRVDFAMPSMFWKGAVATIVPDPASQTWGTLWEIDLSNLPDIDNQELVHMGWYKPVSVQVKMHHNASEIPARVYVMTKNPKGNVHDMPPNEVPEDRQPSKTYLQVMFCEIKQHILYTNRPLTMANKFYYFGFGSNMLARRIHIKNPTAIRIGAGKLQNYRLDFHGSGSNSWLGAPATIVPMQGAHVFGSIWEIDMCNLKDLDDQEGVSNGLYVPINVPVHSLKTNDELLCRAYHLNNQPKTDVHGQDSNKEVPLCRQPSHTYLKVLVKGAEETGVPSEYVKWLRGLRHNGNSVEAMELKLELSEVKLS
ncbi:hypothetical protein ACLKA6_007992 [Drosophila palustris]